MSDDNCCMLGKIVDFLIDVGNHCMNCETIMELVRAGEKKGRGRKKQ